MRQISFWFYDLTTFLVRLAEIIVIVNKYKVRVSERDSQCRLAKVGGLKPVMNLQKIKIEK